MGKQQKTPQSITTDYERQLLANQQIISNQIDALYNDLINQIVPLASIQNMPFGVFTLSKLPTLSNRIDELISTLNSKIEIIVKNGIRDAWELSNNKNDNIADIRLEKSIIPPEKQLIYYDRNAPALDAFLERKVNGLNLSERIYKQGVQLKSELEAGLGEGIARGKSAAELGRDLKQYLKAPDLIFRRVRDAEDEGILKLSKNAKSFHPGQGIYRSSTKNIQRLTRTETNTAYRSSDAKRYQQSPFIIGFEVKTSAQHPKLDICDDMKGKYPVEFKFIGWHPHCLCFSVPILMNDEQFGKYQQLVVNGTDSEEAVAGLADRVQTIPPGASAWIDENKERVAGWAKAPYWWQQNSDFVPKLK